MYQLDTLPEPEIRPVTYNMTVAMGKTATMLLLFQEYLLSKEEPATPPWTRNLRANMPNLSTLPRKKPDTALT
jgi:hypothetical protein